MSFEGFRLTLPMSISGHLQTQPREIDGEIEAEVKREGNEVTLEQVMELMKQKHGLVPKSMHISYPIG